MAGGRGRGRGRGGRGKKARGSATITTTGGRGRGRGRKKMVIESDEEEEEQQIESSDVVDNIIELTPEERIEMPEPLKQESTVTSTSSIVLPERDPKEMETESEKRMKRMMEIEEAMTTEIDSIVRGKLNRPFMASFLTHLKQPPIMERFDWRFKRSKNGESIPAPNIHMCDICKHPILIYGRLIQCKHVFCLSCADPKLTHCPRCDERIYRIETAQLGSIFMCYHEGTHYGYDGCRRTYLSLRDLQAHIEHRHTPRSAASEITSEQQKEQSYIFNRSNDRLFRPLDRPLRAERPLEDDKTLHFRLDKGRLEKNERYSDRTFRSERPFLSERPFERHERSPVKPIFRPMDRIYRPEPPRPDWETRSERLIRPERVTESDERSVRSDRSERVDWEDRSNRSDRNEREDRTTRFDRNDRQERDDRLDRGIRLPERSDREEWKERIINRFERRGSTEKSKFNPHTESDRNRR